MGWANKIIGWATGNGAEVSAANELKTLTSVNSAIKIFCENDPGNALAGVPYTVSPEVDEDFRLRVANDVIFEEEDFTYTAQNFTKHSMNATTFVPSWTLQGFNTNPTNLTTTGATTLLKTYKTFSMEGTETLSLDAEVALTYASGVAIPSNQTVELAFGITTAATPWDTFDAVGFRATSAGVIGFIRNNSNSDTVPTGIMNDNTGAAWMPVSDRKYQLIVYLSPREVEFWVQDPVLDDIWLAGSIPTPTGYGAPVASQAVQALLRHTISGVTAIGMNVKLARWNVRRGGTNISTTLDVLSMRSGESILSPGTLTTTANQTVTTGSIVPTTAAVPANTTSLLASLSGIVRETLTLAAGTDGILMSYQNPALPTAVATTFAPNRRLRIDGLHYATSVETTLTGGGISKHFYIAYGSTSLSLAGVATDTATTKAYRRIQLGIVQAFGAAQAAGTIPSGNAAGYIAFSKPLYINPGEYVALVTRNIVGTAVTAGAAQHALAFDYAWE